MSDLRSFEVIFNRTLLLLETIDGSQEPPDLRFPRHSRVCSHTTCARHIVVFVRNVANNIMYNSTLRLSYFYVIFFSTQNILFL